MITVKKIIYIGGLEHNRSTITDILLSNSSNVISLGEFASLYRYLNSSRTCSCGKKIKNCEFWSKILIANVNQGLINSHRKERSFFKFFFNNNKSFEYAQKWDNLFGNVFKETGAEIIIDSSKNITRALSLLKYSKYEVFFIHLLRDPIGYNNSKNKRRVKNGKRKKVFKDLFMYFSKNLMANAVNLKHNNYLRLKYEDLLIEPITFMEKIEEFTEINLEDLKFKIKNEVSLINKHKFSGNGISRKEEIYFDQTIIKNNEYNNNKNMWYLGGFLSSIWGYDKKQSYLNNYEELKA